MAVSYGKGAKAKATKLHAALVRARGTCQRCYCRDGSLQCAHIISRTYAKTRTDLENAWCLCGKCHFEVDTFAEEKLALVDRTIGRQRYAALRSRAQDTSYKVDWVVEFARLCEVAELSA